MTKHVTGAPACGIFFGPHPHPEEQAARPADEIAEAQHLQYLRSLPLPLCERKCCQLPQAAPWGLVTLPNIPAVWKLQAPGGGGYLHPESLTVLSDWWILILLCC